MPATIQIHELTTNEITGVDKTAGNGPVRFKSVPSTTSTAVDINNPLLVPAAGTNYSFVKKLRPFMDAGPNISVADFVWYTDGVGFDTGVSATVKNLGTTFGTHYDTQMDGGQDLFSYLVGSPLDGVTTDTGPFVPGDAGSYIGDIIELQVAVDSTASNGAVSPKNLTLAYSEI